MPTIDRGAAVISVPWGAWTSDEERTFTVPSDWQVCQLSMRGGTGLSEQEIGTALDHPIGAPAIDDLISRESRVAIAIDDITRPTPAAAILGPLVDRLVRAGTREEHITVVVASGAHRLATPRDIALKVGARLAGRLLVVCHDPAGTLADTGVMLAGVPVRINRAFVESDVRIGIGAVMPHPFAAFSGGGKIVIPGLADLDVLVRTHKYALMGLAGGHELETNRFRRDMEAAVQAIGLHWTVNAVMNAGRRVAYVAAGDPIAAHRAAASAAREIGSTEPPEGRLDALLLNAYPKDGELLQIESALVALRGGALDWLTPSAPIVLMAACTEGMGTHGLFGRGGRLFRVPSPRGSLGSRALMIYSPGVSESDVRDAFWSGYPFYATWDELVRALRALLPSRPGVGVLPSAPLQVARKPSELS